MNRRKFLTRGIQGAVLAPALFLASQPPTTALAAAPKHLQFGQTTGTFYPFPPGRGNVVPWSSTSDDFPDTRGWMSADRTIVTLADPGTYFTTWKVTFEPGGGNDRKTALDVWTGSEDGWHAGGDGGEQSPTRSAESTLLGFSWVVSDGRTKIRVLAGHDLPHPLKLTDRSYEMNWHIWGPL